MLLVLLDQPCLPNTAVALGLSFSKALSLISQENSYSLVQVLHFEAQFPSAELTLGLL